ncbi:MAG: nucleoside kinase [Oscillospiraceae bacterium]|jgi:uridine kinase|nr:nucleoside kinase [Oscillospiraceae bacterium]
MHNPVFDLCDINRKAERDPRSFMAECDSSHYAKLALASAALANAAKEKPVALLAGPSGSGKTTTADKLAQGLANIGVKAFVVSMDDYYLTVSDETHKKDRNGNIDYESPDILDIPLMRAHFAALTAGEEILVPKFDFEAQARREGDVMPLRLGKDEVAIYEGIHALNPRLLDPHRPAMRVYASARGNITSGGAVFFKNTWLRLVRRTVRDNNFRGASAACTLSLWAGVRRGEKKYISPYKELADITIDTCLPYEVNVMRSHALPLFSGISADLERSAELRLIAPRLEEFYPIDTAILSRKSLLREFVGFD